jgi:ribosome-binding factor A
MSNRRTERVSSLVRRELGSIIQELGLEGCGFVTVTNAHISPDLKEGRIHVSVIGTTDQQKRAIETLNSRYAAIQHELACRVVLKYTPHLRFFLDETEAHARRIEQLLDEVQPKDPTAS